VRLRDLTVERQRRAGIPLRLRGYTVGQLVVQGHRTEAEFHAHLRGGDRLGVTPVNVDAWNKIRVWTPGPGRGLLITGPVGVGKSAAAAVLATRELGEVVPARVRLVHDDELRAQYGERWEMARDAQRGRWVRPGTSGGDVLWTDESDLLERQQQASTLDRDPKRQVAEASLLVYDDLGAECGNQGKRADYARDLVARLVRYRYDRRLPLIVTSNLDLDQLGTSPAEHRPGAGLDARTVDRLREMLVQRVRLGGESWRG
jgi:DNA replication protein DnaC